MRTDPLFSVARTTGFARGGWSFYSEPPSVGHATGAGDYFGFCEYGAAAGSMSFYNEASHHEVFVQMFWIGAVLYFVGQLHDMQTVVGLGSVRPEHTSGPGACVLYGATRFTTIFVWTVT